MIENYNQLKNILNELSNNLYDNSFKYNEILSDLETYIKNISIDDIKNNLNNSDIKILLDISKDVYYNTGDLIISDNIYDELESYIGLENKNYIGSKSSHVNYTVKHSFIMGSLSKVQIKEDNKGNINWNYYVDELKKYFNKSNGIKYIQTTPKLDGCSFSAEFCYDKETNKAKLISCATRGDGTYGSDISHWFIPHYKKYWGSIDNACKDILKTDNDILCVRGEVLVPLNIFYEKYSDMFVNPRSFVAGSLGLKKDDISNDLLENNDLHFVCYDYRIYNKETGLYKELGWFSELDPSYDILKPYLGKIGELPVKNYCCCFNIDNFNEDLLKTYIYNYYDSFRKNKSEYALDGVVFKPDIESRQYNIDRERPVDCVAMKFIPMVNSTEIIDIEWNVKKTGEYFPKAIIKPVYLDGKEIRKASLHNYNYIIKNECGIGSKVIIELCGDIVPGIKTIMSNSKNVILPLDSIIVYKNDIPHLMQTGNKELILKRDFLTSVRNLKINGIGEKIALKIFEKIPVKNILDYMDNNMYKEILNLLGNNKSSNNIINALKERSMNLTLYDIIISCSINQCGKKYTELLVKKYYGLLTNDKIIPKNIITDYNVLKDTIDFYVNKFNIKSITNENNINKIPVILTGKPANSSKKEWLDNNIKYIETTKWSECKILFTDDLNSSSNKMKKAIKLGIEIRLYE